MKKLFLSLTVLLSALGVWAQTKIDDVALLSNDKAYSVSTKRGGWAVTEDGSRFKSTNDLGKGLTANYGDIQQAFSFKTIDSKTYLYSIYAEKYVNSDASLSETHQNDITFIPQGDGTFVIKFDNAHYINIGGSNQMIIDGWSEADYGNKVTITDITETAEYIEALANMEAQKQAYELKAAREELYAAIANAKHHLTYDETPVALSTSNVTFNATETSEGKEEYLFDGDQSTYYHSRWNDNTEPLHYFQVDMVDDNIGQFNFTTINRNPAENCFPKTYRIEGSNDGEAFSEIALVTSTADAQGKKFVSEIVGQSGTSYRYLRFNVTSCYFSTAPYFHLAEFSLNKASLQDTYLNGKWAAAIAEAEAADNADATVESLKAAKNKLENPDFLQKLTIRYEFKYNGEVKYTQEIPGIFVGEEYPDFKAGLEMPFGVSVASKPEGAVSAEGAVDDVKTVAIDLTVDLPFVPAKDYASISNWYYLSIKQMPVYYKEGQTAIELAVTEIPVDNKDAYTWAFVGDPFNGYELYNYVTGSAKILSSSTTITNDAETFPLLTANPVPAGNNTCWYATASSSYSNGFFLAQKGFDKNKMNVRNNKLAYWTGGADMGSTFTVKERNFATTADLEELVAKASLIESGTAIGSYSQESVDALKALIQEIEVAIGNEPTQAEVKELEIKLANAMNALKIVAPQAGKFYNIFSACNDSRGGQQIYVSDDAGLKFGTIGNGIGNVFQFVPVPGQDGQYYLYSVERNLYLSTNKKHAQGQAKAEYAVANRAKAITIENMGKDNIVKLTPVGGAMLHAQAAESLIVSWDNTDPASASAWRIVEVENMAEQTFTLSVGELGHSTLYLPFDAVMPTFEGEEDGVYVVKQVTSEGDAIHMEKIEGIVPANTGVIVKAPQGEYVFTYSETKGTATSMLTGTTVDKNVTADASQEYYILSHEEGEVAFFKTRTSPVEVGDEFYDLFYNNAFKAYLPIAQGSAARMLVFRFGNVTGITETENGNVETENSPVFDLSGRRVQKAQKGIFIVDGKKVVR